MARLCLICVLLFVGDAAIAQIHLFHSDHNTPLVEPASCNCTSWRSPYSKVDSSRRRVNEVRYRRGGINYRRTYFITNIDTTWTDVCNEAGGCKGATRVRVTSGFRAWFTDVSTGGFRILSFTLPPCSDKTVNVKDVANVQLEGTGTYTFRPQVLQVPTEGVSKTETVTVTGNGQTLTATIVMVNPANKAAGSAADLEKLKRINENAAAAVRPALTRLNTLLGKSLGSLGEWKGDAKTAFRFNGEQVTCPGQNDCFSNGYRLLGDGEIGLAGRIGIPVTGLPIIGKYLAGAEVSTSLNASLPLRAASQTTCSGNAITASGNGKLTGGGAFAFRVAGFRAEGQVVSEGGGLTGDLQLWPQVALKNAQFNSGKLKVVGRVEDKWGLTQWDVDYTIWNGVSAPLNSNQ